MIVFKLSFIAVEGDLHKIIPTKVYKGLHFAQEQFIDAIHNDVPNGRFSDVMMMRRNCSVSSFYKHAKTSVLINPPFYHLGYAHASEIPYYSIVISSGLRNTSITVEWIISSSKTILYLHQESRLVVPLLPDITTDKIWSIQSG